MKRLNWLVSGIVAAGLVLTVTGGGAQASEENKDGVKPVKAGERAAAKEKKAAEFKAAKEKRDAAKAAAKEKRDEAKEVAKEKRDEAKENLEQKAADRVDKRQDNQAKRIQHGISKGYLTADEIATLDAQQKAITDLESSLTSDGKLSKSDVKQLKTAIDTASRCIWAEKHDTEGKQMSVYRLGRNVKAGSELTSKLSDPNLSATEAKSIMKDFRRMMDLKKALSSMDASAADRQALQSEYDALLNKYFVVP